MRERETLQFRRLKRRVGLLERKVQEIMASQVVGKVVKSERGVKLLRDVDPLTRFAVIDRFGERHDYHSKSAAEKAFRYYVRESEK